MRVSYRIVRESYPIVRVSCSIVYHVKNNIAGTVSEIGWICLYFCLLSRRFARSRLEEGDQPHQKSRQQTGLEEVCCEAEGV